MGDLEGECCVLLIDILVDQYLLVFQLLHLPVLALDHSLQLAVFHHDSLLRFLQHLKFLLIDFGSLVNLFGFLVPRLVLDLPHLLLEHELIGNEDIVEFLVLSNQILCYRDHVPS